MSVYYVIGLSEGKGRICIDVMTDDPDDPHRCLYVRPSFVREHGIKNGTKMDEELSALAEDEHKLGYAILRAADILACGDHSVSRLKQKLVEKGYEREYAERAALYMEEKGYIKEAEAAERAARYMLEYKNRGKRRIAADLIAKGYKKVAVNAAVNSITSEEYYGALQSNLRSKYKEPPADRREREKRVAAMMRQGFDAGDILKAMNEDFDD